MTGVQEPGPPGGAGAVEGTVWRKLEMRGRGDQPLWEILPTAEREGEIPLLFPFSHLLIFSTEQFHF